jgi:hypothetical protein
MKPTNSNIALPSASPTGEVKSFSFVLPTGPVSLISNILKPFVMKTNILKALSLILFIFVISTANAQSDLFAMNTVPTANAVADLYKSNDKVVISDFKRLAGTEMNTPVITVKSEDNVTMQVRIFTLNGELAKEEAHAIENGVNDVQVDMNDLAQGVYMVQFYTKDGSALRRFVKNN